MGAEACSAPIPVRRLEPAGSGPLLVEFDFAGVRRPADYGMSDERPLTIRIMALEVRSGNRSATIDFREECPSGLHILYGFCEAESWGRWGMGRRTAFLLDLDFPIRGGDRLRFTTMRNPFGLPLEARIFLNGHFAAARLLDEETIEIEVEERHAMKTAALCRENLSSDETLQPALSIIMVSLDRPDLVLAAAITLLARPPGAPFELIVVENGTRPALRNRLDRVGIPARQIFLDDAVSFGEANNLAAERARGDTLLLINNDVFVQDDCLAALFRGLMASSGVAAAGPVFHYPDGRLQEAGAYLTPYGLMQITEGTRYGDMTEAAAAVDYISAACLMIRRREFEAIGGFDYVFEPAYYEDSDLCLRLRHWGGRHIRLLREADAVHIRNATSADPSRNFPLAGVNAFNHENFLARWGAGMARPVPTRPVAARSPREDAIATGRESRFVVLCGRDPDLRGEESAFITAALLSGLAPTVMAGPQMRSRFRAAHAACEFGLAAPPRPMTTADALAGESFSCSVTVADRFPPDLRSLPDVTARRRILHVPDAAPADIACDLRALSRFDLIVTPSQAAAQRYQAHLRAADGPAIPFAVLREPVLPFADDAKKDRLLAVAGEFGLNGGEAIDAAAIVARFRDALRPAWEGVVLAEVALGFAEDRLARLRERCERSGIRLLVNPRMATLRSALRRARIFACVTPDDPAARPPGRVAGRASATAIAAGCLPVVRTGESAAELCDAFRLGVRYDALADLDARLLAASDAVTAGGFLPPDASPLFPEAARAAWARLTGFGEGAGS